MSATYTIIHPSDFSHHTQGAFEMACKMAKDYSARLILVHAVPPSSVPVMTDPAEDTQEALKRRFHWPQTADPGQPIEYRLLEGDVAEEILRFAAEINADLIVMGTQGRSGLNRLLTGSVAEEVIRKALCPVLAVKTPPAAPVHHARPGEVIDVRPLHHRLPATLTSALAKGKDLEVIRMVVLAGKEIPAHAAKTEMTVQCLEGTVDFTAFGRTQTLGAGHMLYLPRNESHAIRGVENSVLLLTIVLPK